MQGLSNYFILAVWLMGCREVCTVVTLYQGLQKQLIKHIYRHNQTHRQVPHTEQNMVVTSPFWSQQEAEQTNNDFCEALRPTPISLTHPNALPISWKKLGNLQHHQHIYSSFTSLQETLCNTALVQRSRGNQWLSNLLIAQLQSGYGEPNQPRKNWLAISY